ncbi:neutral ceramidase [Neocloeon triangulifer]|uniref:neutral ceramidase n=1 Tax=Neocloeon triangulifer TaxID=2078957 RepID=UPI00286EEB53|nr:neutral ceramidase [Neocloeon triangulifer]XP_059485798.1 neutral ceramidase [Neocloeon triangulifer]
MKSSLHLGAAWFLAALAPILAQQQYNVGVGIADCTGPAGEITFMGYARLEQKGAGIHLRQFSRAFIFDDGESRVVFISVDVAMISYGIRKEVLERLQKKYRKLYNDQNVIISATHTHSAPGGYNQYLFYDISVLGFMSQTFNGLVNGIVRSVDRAHADLSPGYVTWSQGLLLDANINRSPTAYLKNPDEERASYKYDVDKIMTQLKITRLDGTPAGVINWFPVHPTSMNNTNTLVSSDNVGYASVLFEQQMNKDSLIGKGKFVAAFSSTNLGDVSPNIQGPHCLDNGDPCDMYSSTCDGANVLCVASGPGNDIFESTKIIAERLNAKAMELFTSGNNESVSGKIQIVHQYVDMTKQNFTIYDNYTMKNFTVRGCLPAMGYSFAAGTTDGPGAFSFSQGMTSPNDLWNAVRDFIVTPSDDQRRCHRPKPILFPTGEMQYPFPWQPKIVSTSLAMIGNFAIIPVPGEFTTMAGRRLRKTVRDTLTEYNAPPGPVVIAGLSNTYSSYIVTPEEYELQRYEAASTIYGPHTLTIYQRQYKKLAIALMTNTNLRPGRVPADIKEQTVTLLPPVIFDSTPWDKDYGTVVRQPKSVATIGDKVTATFISGHPRNHLLQEESFMTVEKRVQRENTTFWQIVATDANWETKFHWYRTSFLKGMSEARTEWIIPEGTEPGVYRFSHKGHAKLVFGGISSYRGHSRPFQVVTPPKQFSLNRSKRLFYQ